MSDTTTTPPEAAPAPPRRRKRGRVLIILLALVAVGAVVGYPRVKYAMSHVSTDDAAVTSHITYVSSRITGVAQEVLVDDNQYVEAGTLLARLDDEPLKLTVEQKKAALAQAKRAVDQQVAALQVAEAELDQAKHQARAQLAGLRAAWSLVSVVQDVVRYQLASLRSSVASLRQQEANVRLAQQEYDRVKSLPVNTVSQEEIDQRKATLDMAHEQASAAQQSIQQTRALLGLQQDRQDADVPADVKENFAGTQYAVSSAVQMLANLGVDFSPTSTHLGTLEDKLKSLSEETVINQAPAVLAAAARVRQAQAALGGEGFDLAKRYEQPAVVQAQKELEEAELQLRYTRITAPIAGFVGKRTVNVGTHVQGGQALLTLRPLNDVWVDANFKETQLADLRIGQPVEIRVDAYPGKAFKGRVAGFSPGTGSTMSLLPPENATGNFVKVVQRLPVRIELTEQPPKETPLFAGLSVVPEVDTTASPSGPDAGQRLLSARAPATADATSAKAQ